MNTIEDRDPSTGEVIARVPVTSPAELGEIVARARQAQPAWAELPYDERARRIAAGAERLAARADEIGETITREMGKPIGDARREAKNLAAGVAGVLEEVRAAIEPEILPGKGCETRVERAPLGVVAAITPWNFPVAMPLEILTPALATGNAVVFKPSEMVPLVGAMLAECLGAELPPGVLGLVQGGGDVGAALVDSDIDMIGFVGSRETGKKIMERASRDLKRLVLELGGKDPLIVFDDADLEAAADCAVRHSLRNTGQVCCSVERIYVAEGVADAFEAKVLAKAKEYATGDPKEPATKMGPLVSEAQRAKVAAHVDDAVSGGARLLLGGRAPDGPGYFYPATVLAGVRPEQRISQEETFGPVIAITRFSGSDEDAVRLGNDTTYGLGANVYTGDLERGKRIARRIQSGQVGINRYLGGSPGAPWVGARQSGFGFTGGRDGHRQFTIPRSISYPVGG